MIQSGVVMLFTLGITWWVISSSISILSLRKTHVGELDLLNFSFPIMLYYALVKIILSLVMTVWTGGRTVN